jgi:hypothetical protein
MRKALWIENGLNYCDPQSSLDREMNPKCTTEALFESGLRLMSSCNDTFPTRGLMGIKNIIVAQ